jgi:2',3'-cyclic-nucleotide 2'-phosphodiesterase (5'-nucleotidase family)
MIPRTTTSAQFDGTAQRGAMLTRRASRVFPLVVVLSLVLVTCGSLDAAPRSPVTIQILAVSDWDAQLDPLSVAGVSIGGAAVLSAYFQEERTANPETLTLTAGNAFGASPPLSSVFDDVPAVRAMRLMGFDADTLANHNFDRGLAYLQPLITLAGAPAGAAPGGPFQYVSANLKNRDANLTGVKDFKIFDVGGVKVAVIGLTNPEAPDLVVGGSLGTIEVTDPVVAANRARAAARRAGATVFVAVISGGVTAIDPDTGAARGPLIEFARSVRGFDVILGGQTDVQFAAIVKDALVVENRSKGQTYSRIELTVDPHNGRIRSRSYEFVIPRADAVTPDPAVVQMLDVYRAELATALSTVVGSSTVFIPRADACGRVDGLRCESLAGNAVTDAMRLTYGTEFAITNAGGIRADLTCPTTDDPSDFCSPYTPPPFPISRGQVLTALPFGNTVVTLQVDGGELRTILENGVSSLPEPHGRFSQVSGLCFTYDISAPPGQRVMGAIRQAADGSCTGAPVDLTPASTYFVALNNFMASGGDGYPMLIGRATLGDPMDQVLTNHIAAHTPISPAIQGRVVCATSGATACPAPTP